MIPQTIFDLIPNCPNPAPINVVPFFDGCVWSLIQIPAGVTCDDVLACFTNNPDFIGTLLTSSNGSIVINGHNIEVSTGWLDANINVALGGPLGCDLTIGSTTIDLCSIFSNIMYSFLDVGGVHLDVGNGDTINILGIDGMRFFITPANTLSVGLPAQRQHMQVLTWDQSLGVAYWENNQCCAQTLSFDTLANILAISGTNSVDLTSINTDNQELALNGNILSITQLNAGPQSVDLTNVNEHTLGIATTLGTNPLSTNTLTIMGCDGLPNGAPIDLGLVNRQSLLLTGNMLQIINSDGVTVNSTVLLDQVNKHTLQITGARGCPAVAGDVQITIHDSTGAQSGPAIDIPPPAVACCADVMACPDIVAMGAQLAAHLITIQQMQNDITLLQNQLP